MPRPIPSGKAGVSLPLLILAFAAVAACAKPAAPPWLAEIIARPASMPYGSAKAVVLLDESTVEVDAAGVFTTRTRLAVRILTKDGTNDAVARVPYNTSSDRVTSLEGWLVRSSGEVVSFRKKTVIDVAIYENARELYGEARAKLISAKDESDVGDVFAYESMIENNALLSQRAWSFDRALPVEYSGITVTLPPGWQVAGRTFNRAPVSPIQRGRNTTWELRDLPAVEAEPMSPPATAYRPWLALDIRPPAGAKTRRVTFASWPDIAAYFSPKFDAAAAPDPALQARAGTLVAGAATPWDRISRLCRYAQEVNYISINLNAAEGGGMIPRPASRVFQCNYGDCKDKVTLLRALLRTQGVDSIPLIVFSGGGRNVIPDWPSPTQFNHCILAIRVDPAPDVPAKLVLPKYGTLVLFDPTSAVTPPGWLPEADSDGRGLLLAGSGGDLIAVPPLPPEQDRVQREITARLLADGSIFGTVREDFQGQAASTARMEYRQLSPSDFEQTIARWVGRTMPAARISHLEAKDEFEQGRFSLTTTFAASAYGKQLRDVLLVFKPVVVGRRSSVTLKKGTRHAPVQIEASSFSDHSRIELPPEFGIDELPRPVDLKAAFGEYRARVEAADGKELIVERSLQLTAATMPAGEYESVRAFFEKILEAEQMPVVLRRKPAAPSS